MEEIKDKAKQKKWHQHWWGILFLILIVAVIILFGYYLYRVAYLVGLTQQENNQPLFDFSGINHSQGEYNKVMVPEHAPVFGPEDASIVIVEFSDFQCPYCRLESEIMSKLRKEYANTIKFVFRDAPNPAIHTEALNASMAARCANEQNMFWPYHDLLYENQSNLSIENLRLIAYQLGLDLNTFNQCYQSNKYLLHIQADIEDAIKFGVTGTPTFVINGNVVPGAISYENFKEIIDQAIILEREKTEVPQL